MPDDVLSQPLDIARGADAEPAVGPPLSWLGGAIGATSFAAVLLTASGEWVNFVGYLLATVITILLVSGFRSIDSRRSSRPTYVIPAIAQRLRFRSWSWLVLAAGMAIGTCHVWRLADVLAR